MNTAKFLKSALASALDEKNNYVAELCRKALNGDTEALETVGAFAAKALGSFNLNDNAFLNFSFSLNANERVFICSYLQNTFAPSRIKLPLKNAVVVIQGRQVPCDGSTVEIGDASVLRNVFTAGDLFGIEVICGDTREDLDIRVFGTSADRTGCLNKEDDVKMFYLDSNA